MEAPTPVTPAKIPLPPPLPLPRAAAPPPGGPLSGYESFVLRWGRRVFLDWMTPAGRLFFGPTILYLLAATISLERQIFVLLIYAGAIWAVAIGGALLFRPRARLSILMAERVCAGESAQVEAHVANLGPRPGRDLFVRPLTLPAGVGCEPEDGGALPPLPAGGGAATARFRLLCPKRGSYRLGGFAGETDFPFGWFRTRRIFADERPLLVYPRFLPIARLTIPTGRRYQPGGVALASVVGDSMEFVGNREYREGDNVRDIDWRATARHGKPIVREYREEYFLRVAVVLDTHVPRRASATRREDFERAVSACASVGDYLARQEYVVDLFAAGPNVYHLTAGRSLAYRDQILDILACVDPSHELPFATLEPELAENLSQISAVVCVLLDWDDARRAFVEQLKRQGVGMKVVVVNAGKPTLDPAAEADWLGRVPVIDRPVDIGVLEDL
ncbi:MAG: DUF58 domain-containing protein [Planctomycetes bacterium]|nr:DUF58 domain-containing protein [Planctomycetota bacterium]